MEDLSRIIGERIRALRKERGLNQEELAYQASLNHTYIGKIERGEKNLSLESLVKIMKALDITLGEFFTLIDPKVEVSNNFLEELVDLIKSRNANEQKKLLEIMKTLVVMFD